jgi:hypothetical protein
MEHLHGETPRLVGPKRLVLTEPDALMGVKVDGGFPDDGYDTWCR